MIGIELLKSNNDIKGIAVDGKEIKVTQFADDTTVFVNDHQSVINLLKLLKHTSGLEINTSKTEATRLGELLSHVILTGLKNRFKLSAFSFRYNSDAANNLNFGEKIIKLKNTLKNWKRRKLTLHGRIKIVKTLGLSKLIYNTSVLEIPDCYVKEIKKLSFDFTWEGKPAKLKRP